MSKYKCAVIYMLDGKVLYIQSWISGYITQVQLASKLLRADYVVEVHMQSYNNPINRAIGQEGDCCDLVPDADSTCSEHERCDSYFIFCLRPLNTSHTQRGCDAPNITSEVAHNNASIDFTNSTFLGITNPFHLNASRHWQVRVSVYYCHTLHVPA